MMSAPAISQEEEINIPTVFQRVEYIESDGNQFVNTGVNTSIGFSAKLDLLFTETPSTATLAMSASNSNGHYWGQYNGSFAFSSSYTTQASSSVRSEIEYYIDSGTAYIKTGEVFAGFPYSDSAQEWKLFSDNAWASSGSVRLWGAKFYENGVLVRNFIPCYRKRDGKPGLWDMVGWKFYENANASATDFTVGDDIAPTSPYIIFVDQEVASICVQNFSSDGRGVTFADAAGPYIFDPTTIFRGNSNIVTFDELQYFTGFTRTDGLVNRPTYGLLQNCSNLKSVILPPGFIIDAYNIARCPNLEYVEAIGNLSIYVTDQFISSLEVPITLVFRSNTPPSNLGQTFFWGTSAGATLRVPYSSDHSVLQAYQTAFANVSGSGNFIWEEFRTDNIMPSLYQEVAYLQGDGNAYIDLGITTSASAGIKYKIGGQFFCGGSNGSYSAVGGGWWGGIDMHFHAGYSYDPISFTPTTPFTVLSNYMNSGDCYINDTYIRAYGTGGASEKTCLLFALNGYDGNPIYIKNGTLYYFQLTDGQSIIMDLHPCYRKSDNTPGMFDFITRRFFANTNSTGAFTVGSRIPPKSQFFIFVDKEVEAVSQNNFNGGDPLTLEKLGEITSQQFRGKFKNNTSIVAFEEFQYFTEVDTLYEDDGFYGCSNLVSLKLPDTFRLPDWGSLSCPSLAGTFVLPAGVQNLSRGVMDGTTALTNLVCLAPSADIFFVSSGNGTGILYTKNLTSSIRYINANYKHIIIDGNVSFTSIDWLFQYGSPESIRIKGNYNSQNGDALYYKGGSGSIAFVELFGQTNGSLAWDGYTSGAIIHLGYNGIAGTPGHVQGAGASSITKIYVGSGESQAADQAVLNQYLADPDWAQYSSKLDLWYNYNGPYKNWPTIPTA